jgi:hypothetical protein
MWGGGRGRVHCGDASMGCYVGALLGDGALGCRTNGLWGRDESAKQAGCAFRARQGELGLGKAEIVRIGDRANGRVDVGRPGKPHVSMWHWVGSHVGCGRWCGVHGAVVALPYPVVLAFPWLVYLVTYLLVAAGGFVLEFPRLMYLILPVFELFALDYPIFAVFKLSVLVLGFPTCGSLNIVMWVTSCLVLALFGLPLPPCTHLSLLVRSFACSGLLLYSLSFLLSPLLSLVLLSFRPPLVLFVIMQFCIASFDYHPRDDHCELCGHVTTWIRGSG